MSSTARLCVARGNVLTSSASATLARRKKRVRERQNITRWGSLTMHGERIDRPGVTDGSHDAIYPEGTPGEKLLTLSTAEGTLLGRIAVAGSAIFWRG